MNLFTTKVKNPMSTNLIPPAPSYAYSSNTIVPPDAVTMALAAKDNSIAQAKLALTDAITEFENNLVHIEKGQESIASDLADLEAQKTQLLIEQTTLVNDHDHVSGLLKNMQDALQVVAPTPIPTGTPTGTLTINGSGTISTNTVNFDPNNVQTTPTSN